MCLNSLLKQQGSLDVDSDDGGEKQKVTYRQTTEQLHSSGCESDLVTAVWNNNILVQKWSNLPTDGV